MGGTKRRLDESNSEALQIAATTNKKRKGYSEDDKHLAKAYSDLADDIEATRIQAAAALIKQISSSDAEGRTQAVDSALIRLIKGVASGRKGARIGFSMALTEVVRIALAPSSGTHTITNIVDRITKQTILEGNVSGQEKRDALLGAQFAFQAVLTAAIAHARHLKSDLPYLINAITNLAAQKPWLRRQLGARLHEAIELLASKDVEIHNMVAAAWTTKHLWKTPEGVALWLKIQSCSRPGLPDNVWTLNDPLAERNCAALAQVMQETLIDEENKSQAGTRQIKPSFAWQIIIGALVRSAAETEAEADGYTSDDPRYDTYQGSEIFKHFWLATVENGLFGPRSSIEKKALGLQVVSSALQQVGWLEIQYVLSPNVLQCVVNHRSNPERHLFEATKVMLKFVENAAKRQSNNAGRIIHALLDASLSFDQITKTKTIESILAQADADSLNWLGSLMFSFLLRPGHIHSTQPVETKRRAVMDLFPLMLRVNREAKLSYEARTGPVLSRWVQVILDLLSRYLYDPEPSKRCIPELSTTTLATCRARLMSCLGLLLNRDLETAIMALQHILQLAKSRRDKDVDTLKGAFDVLEQLVSKPHKILGKQSSNANAQGLRLLISMSMLQVYNDEPDAAAALQDLVMSVRSWNSEGGEAKTILVEILISFVSKPSAAYRKLAEQVFGAFASSMTSDSLQSLLDILEQKESATGQRELFADDVDEQDGADDGDDSVDEVDSEGGHIDVEDDSDVEITNGVVTKQIEGDSDDKSDEDSGSNEDNTSEAGDENEEAIFDRKLADALGTAGDMDGDDDGSDMDDDQMMELEPHLATIFKERKKQTSTKKDNKDARENIINFKNRILDLLSIYVKQEHASPVAMEIIHPLIVLMRTTSSKPTAEKAYAVLKQYFDAYTKDKTTQMEIKDATLFALLTVLHAEVTEGGSKLHTSACSRSCLFLAKVLVASKPPNYAKIAKMYSKLQGNWYQDPESKIQPSMFTEWNSWSIATRKQ